MRNKQSGPVSLVRPPSLVGLRLSSEASSYRFQVRQYHIEFNPKWNKIVFGLTYKRRENELRPDEKDLLV
jgi:hypothetical protein